MRGFSDFDYRLIIATFPYAGVDEIDGYEGVATLVVVVLQVRRFHDHIGRFHDVLFPRQSRWSSDHQLHSLVDNVRLPAALHSVTHHLLFRHLDVLLKRSHIILCKLSNYAESACRCC